MVFTETSCEIGCCIEKRKKKIGSFHEKNLGALRKNP